MIIKEMIKAIFNGMTAICTKIANGIFKITSSFINLFIDEED